MKELFAGAAKIEITPPAHLIDEGRIYLWGFGFRTEPATGVRDPIWSSALAISDGYGGTAVLASLDTCALTPEFTASVRQRIARSHGLPPQSITLNLTHTHSAPVTVAIPTWHDGVDRPDPEYMTFLEEQVVASIQQALDRRQPAQVEFARGESTIGFNRHFPDGAVDRTLDVVRVSDANGTTLAVAFFHACHPVFLRGQELSADYVGVARDAVEAAAGGIALFFQGFAGTINPQGSDMIQTGQQLAQDVIALLQTPMQVLSGPVHTVESTSNIPLQPLTPEALQRAIDHEDINVRRWANAIQNGTTGASDVMRLHLQAIRIGTTPNAWTLLASAHEVVAEYAEPVRAIWQLARPSEPGIQQAERVTLLAFSNSQMGYLPTVDVLNNPPCRFPIDEQGALCSNYEGGGSFVWYGHRAPPTPDIENIFLEANRSLQARLASLT